MKKLLKILGYIFLLVIAALFFLWLINNEKEPMGEAGPTADLLAEKMMAAVNKPAWDSTRFVQWTFASGNHEYFWDKERNFVKVNWKQNEVLLNTKTITGLAWQKGVLIKNDAGHDLLLKAWDYFCNDSYWLNPIVKAFDPGTERSVVKLEDGQEGLKVQYKTGGVTPGDSYVWLLDDNSQPTAWKMWVGIIPLGGIESSWEDWQTLSTGAQISTTHAFWGKPVKMISNIKAGMELLDFELSKDPFIPLF